MFNIETELNKIPDYQRFYTLDEMLAHARDVASRHPELYEYQIVGQSTDGEDMPMLKIGTGDTSVLLFASPHPNEPIGAMLVQFLLDELIHNETLRTNYTWYLLPCVDPDGTRLNEGWFSGPYTIRNYARHFYRPPSAEQVEWTFPVHYKDLHFTDTLPETRALINAFEIAKPRMVYSLHNAGFGGVYYYISHDVKDAYADFHAIPEKLGLALSLGESEMPWAKEFAPAVFRSGSIKDAYDYYEQYSDRSPAEIIQGGGSSGDYLREMRLPQDPLLLITELPYFQCPKISDLTPTDRSRKDVILEGVQQAKESTLAIKAILERIKNNMTLNTRCYRAVTAFSEQLLDGLESKEAWARNADNMNEAATVAQTTDELYIGSFYRLLVASMLRRALTDQLELTPSDLLVEAQQDLEKILEAWTERLESNLEYEAIPIRKLVQVQYGGLLAVLRSGFFQQS